MEIRYYTAKLHKLNNDIVRPESLSKMFANFSLLIGDASKEVEARAEGR